MDGLSEAERDLIADVLTGHPMTRDVPMPDLYAAVEAILAARLASVEALHYPVVTERGTWCHHDSQPVPCATLRAVLGSDAHTEACGATYHGHACTLHVGHTSNHLSRDENVNPVASWHDAHTEQKGTGE